ncbi:capsular biosynthesis protein [Pseudoalteromonas espejiana]|uniref:Capsular polysaccharide biosynthesis protein n=1 Tax=Pseudoalteromonas espejiana TaxID=28107 RepID=A0A510XY09_9GAMM|nr:capsular biosynthesis protein [Pseudoalteromonas espejiana]GEK55946.1 hypothetical protein PES01_27910 [Pseudoalteromonas espejiana]
MDCQLHVMGAPKLSAVNYLPTAFKVDFTDVLNAQLKRKRARNSLWNNAIISAVYKLGLGFFERLRYAKYLALLTQIKPEVMVIWNGNKLPNTTVAMAAKALGIKQFYYENGLLPGTTSLDPQGINYHASLSRDPEFYLNFNRNNALNFDAPDLIPRENHKKRCEFEAENIPKRYIFVPFQVPHDTQIASFSPWIDSMEMLYDEVVTAVRALNDPELKVVFKEHPSWHKHYRDLYNKDPIALFANGNKTCELIERAEAVITINSTVGLEALQLNKRVITVGQACYNIEGLVKHASTSKELAMQVDDVVKGWQFNPLLRDKFFCYLKHIYSVPGVWKHAEEEHIKAIELRFKGADKFSLHHLNEQVAQNA